MPPDQGFPPGVPDCSRYAQRLAQARPELFQAALAAIDQPFDAGAMRAFLAAQPAGDEAELKRTLRRLRQQVMLRVLLRDLSGRAALAEVVVSMSDLAELSLGYALERLGVWLQAQHGTPMSNGKRQELIVVGMGKLGGRELNVSSDIDLIFVYPEEGETVCRGAGSRPLSNHEYFTRLGRKLINALADITEDGQVFRVDMRLRPNGDSGALACSFDALENYFIAEGREWERYAWIKARVVATSGNASVAAVCGDHARELAAAARPFVFRKYLDFGAFAAMRSLHAQIRAEVARRDLAGHIKLGPGGIREIEFIAQAFQLIRGGRDAELQTRPTLEVLTLLQKKGLLPAQAVAELRAAYDFLRRLEHRLQYLDDAQTHELPAGREDQALIAKAMGFEDYAAFMSRLDAHREQVSRQFDGVFAGPVQAEHSCTPLWLGQLDAEAAHERLSVLGFSDTDAALARLAGARTSPRYLQLPQASLERYDALVPHVIELAAKAGAPEAALARALDLLDAISRRGAYLALLHEYPQALEKVVQLLAASGWAAAYVTRHPLLLDELLDARTLYAAPDWEEFAANLRAQLSRHEGDAERLMNVLREAHHAQVFRLLAQDLAGQLTVEVLADHLSALADLMLAITLELCWEQMRKRHREVPRFAIAAYGKLGGKELGYASDLDIIFLYDDADARAPELYSRLAQRINTWLTSATSSGVLFETDLRLRPNGASGLMVSSVDAFREYQEKHAWVWEHQALTRARYCAGDATVGAAFEAERSAILRRSRDPDALRREVVSMRQQMADAHPNRSELFDLKHDRGGMIDIEFMVQYLVLAHAQRYPRLTGNLGNIALLKMAGELGLIPLATAMSVRDGYRVYRKLQHAERLNGAQYARVEQGSLQPYIDATLELWQEVFASGATSPAGASNR
ncbi:MAG: bifunctional [glutamate--ammonia ligase]-adenylyl-L-tyrosine phosphorylase/[glutamate--ammonia-ligase] adenylyltransferase [Betaproteobacteria bacterium]|nr:bifunctional [glutamate--ammonia ligase]-adenylyl-L-tyrosine phosphorylase/[glutamate--ammonia-ligase] adenylyltransferase [Betaproteobacteria bacterium]